MTSFGWWETFVPENEEKTNGVLRTNCLRLLISPLRYVKTLFKIFFVLTMRINTYLWHWINNMEFIYSSWMQDLRRTMMQYTRYSTYLLISIWKMGLFLASACAVSVYYGLVREPM